MDREVVLPHAVAVRVAWHDRVALVRTPYGHRASYRIILEHLETRVLMATVPVGTETSIGPLMPLPSAKLSQVRTAVAEDKAGDCVVVWSDERADGSGMAVFARRLDSS